MVRLIVEDHDLLLVRAEVAEDPANRRFTSRIHGGAVFGGCRSQTAKGAPGQG